MRIFFILLGLLFALPAFAQPALDGHGTGTSSSGTTVTLSMTTVSTNEIVIATAAVRASGTTTNPNLSISGCGLTWTQLGTQSQFNNAVPEGTAIYAWYAKASSTLSACTTTITSTQTIRSSAATYCTFSGTVFSSPFDPHTGLPASATNSTNGGVSDTVSMSSTLAHDAFVATFGQVSTNIGGTGPTPAGAVTCANVTNSTGLAFSNSYIVYKTYTTTQTGINIGLLASDPYWGMNGTVLTADTNPNAAKMIFRGFP